MRHERLFGPTAPGNSLEPIGTLTTETLSLSRPPQRISADGASDRMVVAGRWHNYCKGRGGPSARRPTVSQRARSAGVCREISIQVLS